MNASRIQKIMRTYLITGSSRGIGLGLVKRILHLEDSRVIATCRSPSTTSALNSLTETYGDRIIVMMLDVTSEWSFEVLKNILREKKIECIDVLIANAGVAGERDTFYECEAENFNEVFQTNVFGPMLTYQNLSSFVTKSKSKIFVTMSSTMGSITRTGEGYPQRPTSYSNPKACTSYRVSKCASNMLSMILSREPDIKDSGCKILCINPGLFGTGGRTATFTIEECAENIVDIISRTISLQEKPQGSQETVFLCMLYQAFLYPLESCVVGTSNDERSERISKREKKEFEDAFIQGANCIYVNFDGSLIPW